MREKSFQNDWKDEIFFLWEDFHSFCLTIVPRLGLNNFFAFFALFVFFAFVAFT